MKNLQAEILNKVLNAIDSDDLETIAAYAESNLLKTEMDSLQKMLKSKLFERSIELNEACLIRQFLSFI